MTIQLYESIVQLGYIHKMESIAQSSHMNGQSNLSSLFSNSRPRGRNVPSNGTTTSRKLHSHHQYTTGSNGNTPGLPGKPKYTTRHLAALDFLLNIPMKNETKIRDIGLATATRMQTLDTMQQLGNEDGLSDLGNQNNVDGNHIKGFIFMYIR